jgi:metallophosphoesterase (TIGR00282 family)
MGKAGRKCLDQLLKPIHEEHEPDLVLINGENAAGGFGITHKIYEQFVNHMGIDCITMGNHWSDKREIIGLLDRLDRMVIPANMANVSHENYGLKVLRTKKGVLFAVINLIGHAFMQGDNRPIFTTLQRLFDQIPASVKIRIIDIHAEATSEKQAVGWFLAGKASLVYGTHSHVPSADERILKQHTGFVTDLGMTGSYDSVIGIRTDAAIQRLLTGQKHKFEPATENPWLMAILADIDDHTGQCVSIKRLRIPLGSSGAS